MLFLPKNMGTKAVMISIRDEDIQYMQVNSLSPTSVMRLAIQKIRLNELGIDENNYPIQPLLDRITKLENVVKKYEEVIQNGNS